MIMNPPHEAGVAFNPLHCKGHTVILKIAWRDLSRILLSKLTISIGAVEEGNQCLNGCELLLGRMSVKIAWSTTKVWEIIQWRIKFLPKSIRSIPFWMPRTKSRYATLPLSKTICYPEPKGECCLKLFLVTEGDERQEILSGITRIITIAIIQDEEDDTVGGDATTTIITMQVEKGFITDTEVASTTVRDTGTLLEEVDELSIACMIVICRRWQRENSKSPQCMGFSHLQAGLSKQEGEGWSRSSQCPYTFRSAPDGMMTGLKI